MAAEATATLLVMIIDLALLLGKSGLTPRCDMDANSLFNDANFS